MYQLLLKETIDEIDRAELFHHLENVKNEQGEYTKAVELYEKALETVQRSLPENDRHLAT